MQFTIFYQGIPIKCQLREHCIYYSIADIGKVVKANPMAWLNLNLVKEDMIVNPLTQEIWGSALQVLSFLDWIEFSTKTPTKTQFIDELNKLVEKEQKFFNSSVDDIVNQIQSTGDEIIEMLEKMKQGVNRDCFIFSK